MNAVKILSFLEGQGIRIWSDGDALRYNAPPGGLTVDLRNLLVKHKTEILTFLREGNLNPNANLSRISRARRDLPIPLSFAQERLWFLDRLEPGSSAYNVPNIIRVKGELNIAALEKVLNEIWRRHEVLRTTFGVEEGKAVQVIQPHLEKTLPIIDIVEIGQQEVDRLIDEETRRPFDLTKGPVVRASLIRLDEREYIVAYSKHHIVSDAWSNEILNREIGILYRTYCDGKESPLEALPIQYADYAVWQRGWLSGEELQKQLDYWKKRLAGASAVLDLPTDRPRPVVQTYSGASEVIQLDRRLGGVLRELSQREGTTLFMTLMAAFKVLLSRYCGQEDIVVGTPVANRSRKETEGLIGFFVNTLAIRTDLGGDPSFVEILRREREVCLGAYDHQDLPFEKLVDELRPDRDMSQNPIFQVMFVLENTGGRKGGDASGGSLGNLEFASIGIKEKTAKFDLTLTIAETGQDFVAIIEYNTDLFERGRIVRLSAHLQRVLESIAEKPDKKISEIDILSEAESKQIEEWNQTSREYPKSKCIHETFEEHARNRSEAVALVHQEQQLSYGELDRRANRLAHYLRSVGVGPEVIVGICADRSLEMIIGVLSILKAGGAYLAIDPNYPKERFAFLVKDAQLSVLLTQEKWTGQWTDCSAKVVRLDSDWTAISQMSDCKPSSGLTARNLAYVVYTSGSTGQPKGAMITHEGLINMFLAYKGTCKLNVDLVHLQMASFSFDVFVGDFLRSLCSGGKLILCPKELLLEPENLYHFMEREQISCGDFVPALLRSLVAYLEKAQQTLGFMRLLIVGSDSWLVSEYKVVQRFCDATARLINFYGVSEVSVDSSYFEAPNRYDNLNFSGNVPLGRPIANTQLYVLNQQFQMVPIGVPGELCIGGAGLARGYHHQPELTADRFIANPFGGQSGERLYRTGDLARYRADGNIEFLGRVNQSQIKIRGFRIESGEVEAKLGEHAAVRENVVIMREDEPGQKRLVAYAVIKEGKKAASQELREYLKGKLPDYMVPSAIVILEKMPLTPNRKVDRKALPKPHRSPEKEGLSKEQTAVEELLAGIWKEVLKLKEVGVNENFFELGGHSLLATQLISRMREIFKVELPLRSLFDGPTIASLAERVEVVRRKGVVSSTLSLVPVGREKALPLSFAQERLWFLDQLQPNSAAYNMRGAFRIYGPLDVEVLERAINEIIRRHEALRTTYEEMPEGPVQVVHEAQWRKLQVVNLEGFGGDGQPMEARRLAEEEGARPFDLRRGPLVRTTLLRLKPEEHVILYTIHHITSDGWSMEILNREISELHEAYSTGKISTLPELPIQYADYAVWQRAWLQGEVLEKQIAYWKERLKDVSPLSLPLDYPRPMMQTFNGAAQEMRISPELARGLKELSQRKGMTLYMTLLAGFQVLLSRYSGQEDIAIGSPIANRNRKEAEGLIGFFVNTLVMRTDLRGDPTVEELLKRVREVTLGAYEHQDLPFEKLVGELQPERDLSRSPIFQVMFVLQTAEGRRDKNVGGEELQFAPMGFDKRTTKFDLTLSIADTGQGLVGGLEYNTDLFEGSTMARMSMHFERVLASMVENSEKKVSEIEILNEMERKRAIENWNQIAQEQPVGKHIHELFEEQVEKNPDTVALVYEGTRLTYRELNQRSNRLAYRLREFGVAPETLVGICVERSVEMVIGILGVWKAAGGYVPIDPKNPLERIDSVSKDARLAALLTQRSLEKKLSRFESIAVYLDEKEWDGGKDPGNPIGGSRPENVAYVVYTSGSTGQPKGVTVEHRQLTNYVLGVSERMGLGGGLSYASVSTIAADLGNTMIFPALSWGGTLHLISEECAADPELFAEYLKREEIDCLKIVPSHMKALQSGGKGVMPRKRIILGGEASEWEWAKSLREEGSCEVYNHYGPTETTVGVIGTWVSVELKRARNGTVPLGRPLGQSRIYLLDRRGGLVPVGVAGEIYIGGNQVSRGYLNRAELSAERFMPDPFSREPGGRLYRTGDIGRYQEDGTIEFLGRVDNQVKMRGYRIELGEIENVLRRQPSVKEAAVVMREEEGVGDKRLVGYVILEEGSNLGNEEIRSRLRERLPDYMVPGAIVLLDELPLTSNGKVNREALPEPEVHQQLENYEAPQTTVEKILAEIWAKLLRVEKVGMHNNFFVMGGHSLLATQVISRIRQAFGIELPLRSLFEAPTIATLAPVIVRYSNQLKKPRDEKNIKVDRVIPNLQTSGLDNVPDSEVDSWLRKLILENPDQ